MSVNILTVSQLNTYVKATLEENSLLKKLYIKGEISNFTNHYQSGHLYFSLKDKKSIIRCVMFSTHAKRVKFQPKEGMEVIVRAKLTVYEPSGQYQLNIDDMQPDGLGALNLAFEQLKEKLFEEGLFDDTLKKPLPYYPEKIGIITSPTGAAVQDMFRILNNRWPLSKIVFCPCTVQGDYAEGELIQSLKLVEKQNVDVIIIGRGGGSAEDLWAFNSEKLARAIFACKTPVVSAVGHETDYTISDFVADVRAATPSAAAQITTPDINNESEKIAQIKYTLRYFADRKINEERMKLDNMPSMNISASRSVNSNKDKLIRVVKDLELVGKNKLNSKTLEYVKLTEKLDALNPLKVFVRGYAMLEKDEKIVSSVKNVNIGDEVNIKLADGDIKAKIIDKR